MIDENTKNSLKLKKLNALGWVAIILFLMTTSLYFYNFHGVFSNSKGDWGAFGDFIGGTLNPLFAFLSLIAIIYTISIQTQELEYSREELKATKDELAKSADAQTKQSELFEMQNKSINQQTFENTFFKLLEHHNELIGVLYDEIEKDGLGSIFIKGNELIESLKRHNQGIIKTYFMTLYQILKFVDKQNEKFKDENSFDTKFYINIIRATLDDGVLSLLAIEGVIEGFDKSKMLIEKYELLEHLNIDSIPLKISYDWAKIQRNKKEEILEVLFLYNDKAFGKNTDLITLLQEKRMTRSR